MLPICLGSWFTKEDAAFLNLMRWPLCTDCFPCFDLGPFHHGFVVTFGEWQVLVSSLCSLDTIDAYLAVYS